MESKISFGMLFAFLSTFLSISCFLFYFCILVIFNDNQTFNHQNPMNKKFMSNEYGCHIYSAIPSKEDNILFTRKSSSSVVVVVIIIIKICFDLFYYSINAIVIKFKINRSIAGWVQCAL